MRGIAGRGRELLVGSEGAGGGRRGYASGVKGIHRLWGGRGCGLASVRPSALESQPRGCLGCPPALPSPNLFLFFIVPGQ